MRAWAFGTVSGLLASGLCPAVLAAAYGLQGPLPEDFGRVAGFYFAIAVLPICGAAGCKAFFGPKHNWPEWLFLATVPLSLYLSAFFRPFWKFGAPHVIFLLASAALSGVFAATVSCRTVQWHVLKTGRSSLKPIQKCDAETAGE